MMAEVNKGATSPSIKSNGNPEYGKPDKAKPWTPPDGGYGWVIVLSGFLGWLGFGSISQSGIFMLKVAPDFNVTEAQFGVLNSIQGSGLMLGIFIGPLIGHFGTRPLSLVGTLMISSGYIASSFVYNFQLMFLTYGIMPSIAIGTYVNSAIVAVNQYFMKNSSKANTLSFSGFNVSAIVWPLLATWLCDSYGWRKAFLIEGLTHLGMGIIILILMRPPTHDNTFCHKHEQAHEKKGSVREKLSIVFDISPLKNYKFDLYLIALWLYLTAQYGNVFYTPVRSQKLVFSSQTAAWHVSVLGIVSTIMALVYSPLGDLKCVSKGLMISVGHYLGGTFTLVSVLMKESLHLYIYSAILGLIAGIYQSVTFAFFAEVVGPKHLAPAAGWNTLFAGFAPLTLHITAGHLLERTRNPNSPFYFIGVCQLMCAVVFTIIYFCQRRDKYTSYDIQEAQINTLQKTTTAPQDTETYI